MLVMIRSRQEVATPDPSNCSFLDTGQGRREEQGRHSRIPIIWSSDQFILTILIPDPPCPGQTLSPGSRD